MSSTKNIDGYALTASGLAAMVKDNQIGFLKAYDGAEGLAKKLGSDGQTGLSKSFDFEKQKEKFGKNFVEPPGVTPYYVLIWEGLHDATLVILIASAVVSLILGFIPGAEHGEGEESAEWIEGVAILLTVALVLNVQAATDYSKARQFRKQQEELENAKEVHVIRDGEDMKMHPRELVVGDVLRLAVGDILAADAVLIQGQDINMDESALTGESKLIQKLPAGAALKSESVSEEHGMPFLLSGTNVMSGTGKALVVAVGTNSLQGRILLEVSKKQEAIKTAEEHPDEVAAKEANKAPESCGTRFCKRFVAGVKSFFTFGDLGDSGGNLVEKLDSLAIDIGKGGVIVATIAFLVMIIRWSVQTFTGDNAREWEQPDDLKRLLEFFVTAVTILVVAIPEGLPLAVTLSLAVSMRRMTYDNNQVKHMDSCETMGSATTICSDKTGTLTQNRMTVMRMYAGSKEYEHDGAGNKSVAEVVRGDTQNINEKFIHILTTAIALNSSSTSKVTLQSDGTTWNYEGNATECALLKLVAQFKASTSMIRKDPSVQDPNGNLDWGIHNIPFSSSRKRMSWVIPHPSGKGFRVFSKGAPSYIFDSVAKVLGGDGESTTDFDREARVQVENVIGTFQENAMRTIAIAYKDVDEPPAGGWDAKAAVAGETDSKEGGDDLGLEIEQGLTLISVVGIEDPLRPTVVDAIEKCYSAGVDVRMCTGDALATAIAISKQCNILRGRDLKVDRNGKTIPKHNFAMTGAEFDERVHFLDTSKPKIKRRCFVKATGQVGELLQHPFLEDENGNKIINQKEFDLIWPKLRVLARCQPEDKLTLVRGMRHSKLFQDKARCATLLKNHGIHIFPDHQVVAVTGDGTNDAPALKSADVGFAMGIVGTDIAKQACDIMLLDDNFASIVKAVMWGRNVYDSISKFIQFQLTVNIVAITIAVIGAFAFTASPLSAVQMLWVNMIMDSFASVALATEPPSDFLLERPPYGKGRSLISRVMFTNMFGQAFLQIIVLVSILFADTTLLPGNVEKYPPPDHDGTTVPSVHWSILFNAFVQMQLFNQCNSRKLQTVERLRETWKEWNVFDGITKNPIFIGVLLLEVIMQVIIVQFGSTSFRLTALTGEQWGMCIGIGSLSLLWQFVINAYLVTFTKKPPTDPIEVIAEEHEEIDTFETGDIETGNSAQRIADAKANWKLVRRHFLSSESPVERFHTFHDVARRVIQDHRRDSWVLRDGHRQYHKYDNTKLDEIKLEREVSDTGRDLLRRRSTSATQQNQSDAESATAAVVAEQQTGESKPDKESESELATAAVAAEVAEENAGSKPNETSQPADNSTQALVVEADEQSAGASEQQEKPSDSEV